MDEDVTPELFSPSPLPEDEDRGPHEDEDQELHDGDDTPEDIAGPAHYLEELRDVLEPDQGRDMCRSTTCTLLEVVPGTTPIRDAAPWRIPDDFFVAGGVTHALALQICSDMGPSTRLMLVQWLTWTLTVRC